MKTYYVMALDRGATGVYKTDAGQGYTYSLEAAEIMLYAAKLQYKGTSYEFHVIPMDDDLAGLLTPQDYYTLEEAMVEAGITEG